MANVIRALLGPRRVREISQTYNSLRRLAFPKPEPEQSFLARYIRPGDVVFEVGANYGQYLCALSELVGPLGKVFAFEPAEITFSCLARIAALKKLPNASLHKLAFSDAVGTATLFTPIKQKGTFSIATASLERDPALRAAAEEVELDTIDRFVTAHGLTQLNFLRCDVEGGELKVLRGASGTTARFRPLMLVEVHPHLLSRFNHTAEMVLAHLAEIGYSPFHVAHNRLVRAQTVDSVGNYFLFPRESLPAE